MKAKKESPLVHKYLAGETKLDEEEQFFNDAEIDHSLEPWVSYRRNKQAKAPDGLLNRLARQIDQRQAAKRSLYLRIASLAASVILVALFFFNKSGTAEMSYNEKAAMLEEVLKILPENNSASNEILYEDELLVIYLE